MTIFDALSKQLSTMRIRLHVFVSVPLFAFAILAWAGCAEDGRRADASSGGEETLSTDVVNNPKTAETGEPTLDESAEDLPVLTFREDKHDFGEIIQGEKVEYLFRFTNTGKSDLIITQAKGSCGCTVPEWPKEPIPPGETGSMRVTYDSKGRKGPFNKTVKITANTVPNTTMLYIEGDVIVPQD